MITHKEWKEAQAWEKDWHGNGVNSFWEETKQIVYARKMGMEAGWKDGKYPVYDLKGKSVLDIGGGAYSILLKCINFSKAVVQEPIDHPHWVMERYKACGIGFVNKPGEELNGEMFDICFIYNVLQHTQNPEKIIKNALKSAKEVRIFEWIEEPISPGHIQVLTEKDLNNWLGGFGKVEQLNESGCHGKAFYGRFKGTRF